MKILIVTTAFPRWHGDSKAPFIFESAKALQRNGNDIRILAMHVPGSKKYENWNGIEIYRPHYLPEKWETLQSVGGGLPEVWKKNKASILIIIPFVFVHAINIVRLCKESEIIHANWTLSGIITWLTQWIHHKPYIVTVHGSDVNKTKQIPFVNLLTKAALWKSNKTIAVSKSLAKSLEDQGISREKIVVIPDGVDTSLFQPMNNNRENLILFVGALTQNKGGDLLIKAFSEILDEFPLYHLTIIGEGPMLRVWTNLAAEIKISDHVKFTGQLSQGETAEYMRRSKLLILPSRSEGLGVVLLEALASGTPCIGAKIGGIPDVISPDVGSLFPSEDFKELAKCIRSLLQDQQKLQVLSQNARAKAITEYDWSRIAEKIDAIYK